MILSEEEKSVPHSWKPLSGEREREREGSRKPVTLNGVEKLMQVRDQILQEHGGIPFENSIELLRQERKEREMELD